MKINNPITKVFASVILLILMALIQSCSKISDFSDSLISNIPAANYFTGGNYCTVKIKSSKNTNQGASFCLVVKPTDFPSFILSGNYPEISQFLVTPPKKDSGIEIISIVPGQDQEFRIERTPDFDSLGFYFLFTYPGDRWRDIIKIESGNPVIRIVLDRNEIASIR